MAVHVAGTHAAAHAVFDLRAALRHGLGVIAVGLEIFALGPHAAFGRHQALAAGERAPGAVILPLVGVGEMHADGVFRVRRREGDGFVRPGRGRHERGRKNAAGLKQVEHRRVGGMAQAEIIGVDDEITL